MGVADRDKFLTEAMGECWHAAVEQRPYHDFTMIGICCCGMQSEPKSRNNGFERFQFEHRNNFSTWDGFGKLWEWATDQMWWSEFLNMLAYQGRPLGYIHPDRFADAIYVFLKARV